MKSEIKEIEINGIKYILKDESLKLSKLRATI
jgi:hypothetical protein